MSRYREIRFRDAVPDSGAYLRLFESTGWNQMYGAEAKELVLAISNSWYSVCAFNDENELVGFGRVLSDGVLYALICDMIVAPAYQNQGIGSTILRKLIQRCRRARFAFCGCLRRPINRVSMNSMVL